MVCQGHDLVKYIYHSKPFVTNISKEKLYPLLYRYYAESGDFKITQLYLNLKNWLQVKAGVII